MVGGLSSRASGGLVVGVCALGPLVVGGLSSRASGGLVVGGLSSRASGGRGSVL